MGGDKFKRTMKEMLNNIRHNLKLLQLNVTSGKSNEKSEGSLPELEDQQVFGKLVKKSLKPVSWNSTERGGP